MNTRYDQAEATECIKQQREIPTIIGEIEMQVNSLEKAVAVLTERLSPIAFSQPTPELDKVNPPCAGSFIGKALQEISTRLRCIERSIYHLDETVML